ncbi:MAG: hypothetical protein IPH77_06130 [Ignavibacteria bacterium]|nr:hypothetical protein [Ignavibacteria bacterium]
MSGDVATVSLYNTSCGLIDSRQVTVNGTSVPLSLAGLIILLHNIT